MALDKWTEAGIVKQTADRVFPLFRILPFQGFLVACDGPDDLSDEKTTDFVMGIGGSTLTLANSTIRRRSRLTLDVGTGCGIQSFLAAAHSDRVCAVDRNPRAIGLARFNAHLNGLQNIDFFEGDLFDIVP